MLPQLQEDSKFIYEVFNELKKHSRYHKYVSLHSYQDTVESATLWRRLSETETGLLLGYRSEPDQIKSPFILEVFPKNDFSLRFFSQIPAKVLARFVLAYAINNTTDDLVGNVLESKISQIDNSEEISKITNLVDGLTDVDYGKGIVEDFTARLGSIIYSISFPYVRERYEKQLNKEFYQRLQKTFLKKRQRRSSSKALDNYRREYGALSLSSDIEELKEVLSSEEYSFLREGKVKQLELIAKECTEEVFDIVNQLKFDEFDELGEDEQKKFREKDSLFKEKITEACKGWFNYTSREIDQSIQKVVEGFELGQAASDYILERLEEIMVEYTKKEEVKSEDASKLIGDLNNKYLSKIFSEENISDYFPAVCNDISAVLSSRAGKSALEKLLKKINPHQIYERINKTLKKVELKLSLDESFLAKIYSSVLADMLSGELTKERLLPVMAIKPSMLVDAYVHFKAREAAAFRDNLFSKVQDVIYGDDFSFIIYSTTGAFINTGEKLGKKEGESESLKYALVRLSDAIEVMPPSLEAAVDIVYKLCDSLDHLQRKGKYHRGISLSNVLLSEDVYELLIFGYNPEEKYSPSCFSLPDIINQDLFAVASILYTLIEGKVPFSSVNPGMIKEEISYKYFKRRAKKTPRKILKLIGEVFRNSLLNTNYTLDCFKQRLAKASGRFPSRSYYSFMDYIDVLSEEHKKQVGEKIEQGGEAERWV